MIAIDDGLTSGNLNWADIFFLAAAVIGVLAGIFAYAFSAPTTPAGARWPTPLAYVAIGLGFFGLFLL